MFWLTLLCYVPLVAVTVIARRRSGTWFSPAAFFGAVWSVLGGLPLVFSPISVAPAGMLFVAAAAAAVLAGEWAAQRWLKPAQQKSLESGGRTSTSASKTVPTDGWPLIEWLIIACTFLGILTVLIVVGTLGRGPSALIYITRSAYDLYWANQGGNWQEPITARILVTGTYLGPLLAGTLLGVRTSGWMRWFSLVVLVPAGLLTVVLTTKSSFLLPLLLGFSAFLAARVATGRAPRFNLKLAGLAAAVVLALAAAAVAVQMVRYGGQARGELTAVISLLWSDLFPYLAVFALWFQHGGWSNVHPGFGYYTFAGLFDLLHIHYRPAGLYTEQVLVAGKSYNIYTAFRGLVEDFTTPGALIALGVAGFGAEIAFMKARAGDIRYIAPLAAFYVFALWSWVVNIFIYNTIIAAFVMFVVYLWLARRPALTRAGARVDGIWRGTSPRYAAALAVIAILLLGGTVIAGTGLKPGCQRGAVKADLTSPQPAGTIVTFTGASANCNAPSYEWWIWSQASGWTLKQPYSNGSSVFVLATTGMPPATYTIDAWVEQSGSPVGRTGYETFGILTWTVTGP